MSEAITRRENVHIMEVPVEQSTPAVSEQELTQVENEVVRGVNALITEIPRLVEEGHFVLLEQQFRKIRDGVELARKFGMGLSPMEALRPALEAAIETRLPVALQKLVSSGATSLEYGYAENVPGNRERLVHILNQLQKGVSFTDATIGGGGDKTGSAEPERNALVKESELLRSFDERVRGAVPVALGSQLHSIEGALSSGDVDLISFYLGKIAKIFDFAEKNNVQVDSGAINEKILVLLQTQGEAAVQKAIERIQTTVELGYVSNVAIHERQIESFIQLLQSYGIELPSSNADTSRLIQERVAAGIKKGVNKTIESIISAVRYGYPGNVDSKLTQLEEQLAKAREIGQSVPEIEEIESKVVAGITAHFSEGVEALIARLASDLGSGNFTFFGTDVVTVAHKNIDELVSLGVHAGVPTPNVDELHQLIDRIAGEIRPVK